MSNQRAYNPTDPNKIPIELPVWFVQTGTESEGRCLICGHPVKIKAERSPKRKAHFAHHANAPCPSIVKNHIPYGHLKKMPRDEAGANAAKQFVRENAASIYEKCKRELLAELQWTDFHRLIDKANEVDIWSLTGKRHLERLYQSGS